MSRYGRLLSAAAATAIAASSALAQTAPATRPTTAPAATAPTAPHDWFAPGRPASGLFPEVRADPDLTDRLPRTIWNALIVRGVSPVRLPRMICTGDVFTEASTQALAAAPPDQRDPATLVPDERKVRMLARQAQGAAAAVCLDVEAFPFDPRRASDAQIDQGTRTIARMVGWLRDEAPATRVFLYAIAPGTDYYSPAEAITTAAAKPTDPDYQTWQGYRSNILGRLDGWQRANARVRHGPGRPLALADLFDGVCPSLYLGMDGKSASTLMIQGYVRGHVAEGRRYGKPVYPFVWPYWYETKEPLPLGFWVTQVREVCRFADGMVLWSDGNAWDYPLTFRVRIADEMGKHKGKMTNRELHDALAPDFKGYRELDDLLTLTNEAEEARIP